MDINEGFDDENCNEVMDEKMTVWREVKMDFRDGFWRREEKDEEGDGEDQRDAAVSN